MSVIEGKSKVVTITPALSLVAYSAGDQIGSVNQLVNILDGSGDSATVQDIIVHDKASQSAAFDVLFFNQAPTVSSVDNAALDISDSEMASKFVGRVSVEATDYSSLAASSDATRTNIGLLIQGSTSIEGPNLWCILQSQGTPTYASTSDLVLKIGAFQD